jgi:hypothetical protein
MIKVTSWDFQDSWKKIVNGLHEFCSRKGWKVMDGPELNRKNMRYEALVEMNDIANASRKEVRIIYSEPSNPDIWAIDWETK